MVLYAMNESDRERLFHLPATSPGQYLENTAHRLWN